jgi:hypothetical protein
VCWLLHFDDERENLDQLRWKKRVVIIYVLAGVAGNGPAEQLFLRTMRNSRSAM